MPVISGGGSLATQSHVFTLNRAGGFVSSQTFDLGRDAAIPLLAKLTLISFVGDGETLGNAAGTLYVGAGGDFLITANSDGADFANISSIGVNHFVPAASGFIFELQGDGATPKAIAMVARHVKIEPQLVSNDTGLTYAGTNNPVAVVQVDVTY